MKTYRELNRIWSVTHSPVLVQLSETLSGSSIIRNFSKEREFIEENYRKMNVAMNAEFWKDSVRRWFTIRIGLVGRLVIILSLCLMVNYISHLFDQ